MQREPLLGTIYPLRVSVVKRQPPLIMINRSSSVQNSNPYSQIHRISGQNWLDEKEGRDDLICLMNTVVT